jgi:protein SHQ1
MLRLPRKECELSLILCTAFHSDYRLDLATDTQTHELYLILLTLLFSYAYDARSTQHDSNSESAWTISVLTPAFSALDPPRYVADIQLPPDSDPIFSPTEIAAVLVPSYRRSIAFPLYRSFALAEACRRDVAGLLCKGRRTIVRCLLEMKKILDHHDIYYIYSKIWVEDFCVWTQAYARFVNVDFPLYTVVYCACARDDKLQELATCLETSMMEKSLLGWDLEKLEAVTHQAQDRDDDSDDESDCICVRALSV